MELSSTLLLCVMVRFAGGVRKVSTTMAARPVVVAEAVVLDQGRLGAAAVQVETLRVVLHHVVEEPVPGVVPAREDAGGFRIQSGRRHLTSQWPDEEPVEHDAVGLEVEPDVRDMSGRGVAQDRLLRGIGHLRRLALGCLSLVPDCLQREQLRNDHVFPVIPWANADRASGKRGSDRPLDGGELGVRTLNAIVVDHDVHAVQGTHGWHR